MERRAFSIERRQQNRKGMSFIRLGSDTSWLASHAALLVDGCFGWWYYQLSATRYALGFV